MLRFLIFILLIHEWKAFPLERTTSGTRTTTSLQATVRQEKVVIRAKRSVEDVLPRVPVKTENIVGEQKCYFSLSRKTPYETQDRPSLSEVSTECAGDLTKMEDLVEQIPEDSHGTTNVLDLVLSRGAGELFWNFHDPTEVAGVGARFICARHIDELYTNWGTYQKYQHIKWRRDTRKKVCSIVGPFKPHKVLPVLGQKQTVEKHEALAVLKKEGVLLHVGLPVCPAHKEELVRYRTQWKVEDSGHRISPAPLDGRFSQTPDLDDGINEYNPASQENDPSYIPPPEPPAIARTRSVVAPVCKNKFSEFLETLNLPRLDRRNKDFRQLDDRSKRRKAHTIRSAVDSVYLMIAPEDPGALKTMVEHPENEGLYERRRTEKYQLLMQEMKERFLHSTHRNERLHIISLFARSLSLGEILHYLPGLSRYFYTRAKKYAMRGSSLFDEANETVKRPRRYDLSQLNRFIEFITSYKVTISLPFGVRSSTLSDGTSIEFGNTLRKHTSTEIIEMYKRELKETNEGDVALSDSTMYRILKICSAERRKSLHGVDFYIADAMDSFQSALDMVDEMRDGNYIDGAWAITLRNKLLQAKTYLRTDFKLHVKPHSRIADHCVRHALSDPSDAAFTEPCDDNVVEDLSHEHRMICERCENVGATLGDLQATIQLLTENAQNEIAPGGSQHNAEKLQIFERYEREIYDIRRKIQNMKQHQLRVAVSENDLKKIVEDLEENESLVTQDWAMKWLPAAARESTTDFFGKRGISWHVSHVVANISSVLKQHTFIHIMKSDLQDSVAVTAIMNHTVSQLREAGIKNVVYRSDQAGCYKSSATLSSVLQISKYTKTDIKKYAFSEAQAGKSACDRMAAVIKRKVRDYLDSGSNARTAEEFFAAIIWGKELRGVSVHLTHVEGGSLSHSSIPGISQLNTFLYEADGIRVHRHSEIGQGKLIKYDTLKKNQGHLIVDQEDGALVSQDNHPFWREIGRPERQRTNAEKETGLEHEEQEACTMPQDADVCVDETQFLFQCPEETCAAEFIESRNLERHIIVGKHKGRAERATLRDNSLLLFADGLEGPMQHSVFTIVDDALESFVDDNSNGKIASQGWALKEKKKNERLPERAKQWAIEQFNEGTRTGVKIDPREAHKRMKNQREADTGKLSFTTGEVLTVQQLASIFSRLATAKKRSHGLSDQVPESRKKTKTSDPVDELYEEEGDIELEYKTDPQWGTSFDHYRKLGLEILGEEQQPAEERAIDDGSRTATTTSPERKRRIHDELF